MINSSVNDNSLADLAENNGRPDIEGGRALMQSSPPLPVASFAQYEQCKARKTFTERLQMELFYFVALFCLYAYFMLSARSAVNSLFLLPLANFIYKLVRDFLKCDKARRSLRAYEVYWSLARVGQLAAWVCLLLYLGLKQGGVDPPAYLCHMLGFLGTADLVVDMVCMRVDTVAAFATRLYKLVRVCVNLAVAMYVQDFVLSSDGSELVINTRSMPTSITLLVCLFLFFFIFLYALSKTTDNLCPSTINTGPEPPKETKRRIWWILLLTFVCATISAFLYGFMAGNLASKSALKGYLSIGMAAFILLFMVLNSRYTAEIEHIFAVKLSQLERIYPRWKKTDRPNAVSPLRVGPSPPAQPGAPDAEQSVRGSEADSVQTVDSIHFIRKKNSAVYEQVGLPELRAVLRARLVRGDLNACELRASQLGGPEDNEQSSLDHEGFKPITGQDPQGPPLRDRCHTMDLNARRALRAESEGIERASSLRSLANGERPKHMKEKDFNLLFANKEAVYGEMNALILKNPVKRGSLSLSLLERRNKATTEMCLICEENESECILQPCNHTLLCFPCSLNILKYRHNKCHYCRSPIEKLLVINNKNSYESIYQVIQVFTIAYETTLPPRTPPAPPRPDEIEELEDEDEADEPHPPRRRSLDLHQDDTPAQRGSDPEEDFDSEASNELQAPVLNDPTNPV